MPTPDSSAPSSCARRAARATPVAVAALLLLALALPPAAGQAVVDDAQAACAGPKDAAIAAADGAAAAGLASVEAVSPPAAELAAALHEDTRDLALVFAGSPGEECFPILPGVRPEAACGAMRVAMEEVVAEVDHWAGGTFAADVVGIVVREVGGPAVATCHSLLA